MAYTFAHGTGTEADPYQVWTAADLNGVRDYLSAHYIQMADIDLSGYSDWSPIGYNYTYRFSGAYDGAGHTISNLKINRPTINYAGLFGYVRYGTIKNLGLVNANVAGRNYTGGLAGNIQDSTITNCYSTGNVSGINYVGGLVGGYGGQRYMATCYSAGSVSGTENVGGLVGTTTADVVYDCYSTSNVIGTKYVGGLVGWTRYCSIINCYSSGDLSGGAWTGGLVGYCRDASVKITSCYSTGDVSGTENTGGLVGENYLSEVTITNSYYDSETSGCSDTGKGEPKTTLEMKTRETFAEWDFASYWDIEAGINDGYPFLLWQEGREAGKTEIWTAEDLNNVRNNLLGKYIQMADIDLSGYENWEPIGPGGEFRGAYDGNNCTISNIKINRDDKYIGLFGYIKEATVKNLGLINVSAIGGVDSFVGGLSGQGKHASIYNCYCTGEVSGYNMIGGLVGQGLEILINNCYSVVEASGAYFVGGLVGGCYTSFVYECYSTGSISSENWGAGGLIGENGDSHLVSCYSVSNVSGVNGVGGLVGYNGAMDNSTITNCYSTGNVSGAGYCIGGFVGENYKGFITNSYSTGSASGTEEIGGFVGENDIGSIITNCYCSGLASGTEYVGDFVGDNRSTITDSFTKTTAEMKQQETYIDWDFTDVWGIDSSKNSGYPYLLWQTFEEPFQPWTPPKLEPSWWEGFKLPFNVLELDEDAPIAIQRNFKEIEHYINFLGRSAGEIKDALELLSTAPATTTPEEEWDEEPIIPPTDSYFAGYILGKDGQMGSIDAAIKTDNMGGINEVWIARVIDKQGLVEIYDSDAPEHIFRTVAREFNLPQMNLGADVVDVAIEFDGTYDQYNIFVSETEPHIFWVERTGEEDIIYTVKWGGVDPAPTPVELARAQLGRIGAGITVGLDYNITV